MVLAELIGWLKVKSPLKVKQQWQQNTQYCNETVNLTPELWHCLMVPRYVTWVSELLLRIYWPQIFMLQFKIFVYFFLFGIFILWCKRNVLKVNNCLHFFFHRNLMRTRVNPCWVVSSVNISHQTTVGISCFISFGMVICQRSAFFSPMQWSL